uniref:Uncharacterized protein n=1 Tax=Clytia hemisphaerica TaxID=252671 RepID=A0A7M5WTK1_9CNID
FNAGQMYVAMSRVRTIDGLYFTVQYRRTAFVCSKDVNDEYSRLRQNKIEPIKDVMRSNSTLNVCLLNTRSLRLHVIDIQNDEFLYKNDLLCLTETQMSYESSDIDTQNLQEQLYS